MIPKVLLFPSPVETPFVREIERRVFVAATEDLARTAGPDAVTALLDLGAKPCGGCGAPTILISEDGETPLCGPCRRKLRA